MLLGGKWSYYSGQQENLEENWWKDTLCGLVVQEGEVMIFGPQITSSRFTNTKEQEDTEVVTLPPMKL